MTFFIILFFISQVLEKFLVRPYMSVYQHLGDSISQWHKKICKMCQLGGVAVRGSARNFNLSSHAVGMAVAQLLGFEIDFLRNPISGSDT